MGLLWPHYDYIVAAAIAATTARREAVLWLLCQLGENERLQFIQPLKPPSNLLARASPTLGSANYAHNEI